MAEIARQDLKAPPGGEVTLGLDEAKAWKANVSEIALRLVPASGRWSGWT